MTSKEENPGLAITENLTLSEAIGDNLIALVNAADGVDPQAFAQLLESAARLHTRAVVLEEISPNFASMTQPKNCTTPVQVSGHAAPAGTQSLPDNMLASVELDIV